MFILELFYFHSNNFFFFVVKIYIYTFFQISSLVFDFLMFSFKKSRRIKSKSIILSIVSNVYFVQKLFVIVNKYQFRIIVKRWFIWIAKFVDFDFVRVSIILIVISSNRLLTKISINFRFRSQKNIWHKRRFLFFFSSFTIRQHFFSIFIYCSSYLSIDFINYYKSFYFSIKILSLKNINLFFYQSTRFWFILEFFIDFFHSTKYSRKNSSMNWFKILFRNLY